MLNRIPITFLSSILFVVMLSATINCMHETLHTTQGHMTTAWNQATSSDVSAHDPCPFPPLEKHKDCKGCDTCFNCACHAPLAIQPFELHYHPMAFNWTSFDPFKHLPEVILPKFIPPENQA
jgi:hypothetical protein